MRRDVMALHSRRVGLSVAETTGSKTSLVFYADRDRRTVLHRFVGPSHRFRSFIVPSHCVYYEYQFDSRDPPCFGVRFTVSRLTGLWLEVRPSRFMRAAAAVITRCMHLRCRVAQEQNVLVEPSLEWGCWLLQFLLDVDTVRYSATRAACLPRRHCSLSRLRDRRRTSRWAPFTTTSCAARW